MDVPFNGSLTYGELKEKFSVKELFLNYFGEKEIAPDLLECLGKVDVFTRWHGFQMADFLW